MPTSSPFKRKIAVPVIASCTCMLDPALQIAAMGACAAACWHPHHHHAESHRRCSAAQPEELHNAPQPASTEATGVHTYTAYSLCSSRSFSVGAMVLALLCPESLPNASCPLPCPTCWCTALEPGCLQANTGHLRCHEAIL